MQLRNALTAMPDVRILYVMADNQFNAKSLWFADGNRLQEQVTLLKDPGSRVIDMLGIRLDPIAEPIEEGVPHPTTYVLDRSGVIRLMDVRQDYHIWLDPQPVIDALESIGGA